MFSYAVQVRPLQNPKSKVVAFASLLIDDVLEINGFRVIDGSKGLFVSAPSHKGKNKEGEDTWFDDVRFLGDSADNVKDEVYRSILDSYTNGQTTSSRETTAEAQADINSSEASGKNSMSRRPLW
tara:strand:+ start:334 stop:708 length:375 start_codon:yes stop_codon:yes gene_type:complete